MKFISINGSSCSGKSLVIKNILKQRDHLFHLSYDTIKWSFSKYSSKEQFKDVHAVMLAMAKAVFVMKYDVISESGLYKDWREVLFATARAHGYEVVEIVLGADYEVLERRFDERVARAAADPEARIANRSKERFKELFDIFQKEKNASALTFRSDIQSAEEIAEGILKLL
ncbi:AAA family ATPase [Candidatus Kaiserbacteria bacterium]|nr:AAA family ATPase [Candidatus Kaiserbacteria bacterium]